MPKLTDSELMALAQAAVPERLRSMKARVLRAADKPVHAMDTDRALTDELARRLELKLEPTLSDADLVEYQEQTVLGDRTTLVVIRDGQVARVIGQA